MKVKITGVISKVGEFKKAGNSEVMEVILNKKYHDQDTGELKGEDHYPVQIWKDIFPRFEACLNFSSKMEITGFLNGRKAGTDDKQSFYMNFTAREFRTL